MRPVNLIPPEERQGERAPARTGPVAYILVGVLAAALLGVSSMVLTKNQISDHKAELANLKAQEAGLVDQRDRLSSYANFASLEKARVATVTQLAQSRFDWERVLRELAIVIPEDVWLTELHGQVVGAESDSGSSSSSTSTEGAGTVQATIAAPSLHMLGCAANHDSVARFAASLEDVDGVTRVLIDKIERPNAAGGATDQATAGTGCDIRDFLVSFEITVAFDNAATATAATGTPPVPTAPEGGTEPPASQADQSQVADGQQQEEQQKQSTEQQTQKARENVDNIVTPGVISP